MRNTYQRIKQTAGKYALPAIIAGSLALGACSGEDPNLLPIDPTAKEIVLEKQKKYLDSLLTKANNYVYSAKEIFNEGIKLGELNEERMKNTLKVYEKADELYSIVRENAKVNSLERYMNKDFSCADKKLMGRHSQVLWGLDFGVAELEKDLQKEGINVKVYNPLSGSENLLMLGGVITALLCFLKMTDYL